MVGEADLVASARWCKMSADRGCPPALFGMGLRYMRGDGVEQDALEAFGHDKLAARHGHVPSMLKLAFLYKDGQLGEENSAEAYLWFKRAALRGEPQSIKCVDYRAANVGSGAMMMDKVEHGEMPVPF